MRCAVSLTSQARLVAPEMLIMAGCVRNGMNWLGALVRQSQFR
jgi:hypothetical protein